MSAICVIIAIITSLSRDQLLTVGLSLVATAILHNSAGYVLGYAGARLVGLDESTRRTVAIEVGLQNGGKGVGPGSEYFTECPGGDGPCHLWSLDEHSGSMLASWRITRPAET